MFEEEKRSYTGILVSVVVLVAIAAAGGSYFFHTHNHPDMKIGIQSVRTVPLHVKYAHEAGFGEERYEDATYVLIPVVMENLSDAPYFVKDINIEMTPQEGGESVRMSAMQKGDLPRLMEAVPAVKTALDQIHASPLLRETKVSPHSSATGYLVFQYPGAEDAWMKRSDATLRVDFYHNASFTSPLSASSPPRSLPPR